MNQVSTVRSSAGRRSLIAVVIAGLVASTLVVLPASLASATDVPSNQATPGRACDGDFVMNSQNETGGQNGGDQWRYASVVIQPGQTITVDMDGTWSNNGGYNGDVYFRVLAELAIGQTIEGDRIGATPPYAPGAPWGDCCWFG